MRLIHNANQWHQMWSVRLALMSAVFAAIELSLPLFKVVMSDQWFAIASLVTAVGSAVARVFTQKYKVNDVQESESTDQPK